MPYLNEPKQLVFVKVYCTHCGAFLESPKTTEKVKEDGGDRSTSEYGEYSLTVLPCMVCMRGVKRAGYEERVKEEEAA